MPKIKHISRTANFISYLKKRLEEGVPLSKLTLEDFKETTGADATPLTFRTYVGRARQGTGPTVWLSNAMRKRYAHLLDRKQAGGWLRDKNQKNVNRLEAPKAVRQMMVSTEGISKKEAVSKYILENPWAGRMKIEADLGFPISSTTFHEARMLAKEVSKVAPKSVSKKPVAHAPTIFQSIVSVEGTIDENTYRLLEGLVEGISKFTGHKLQVETTARPKPLVRINATVGK